MGVCALPRAYLRTGNFPRAPIWRLCRNKGLHPLRRYPCTPTKTVHPPRRLYCFCGFYYPIREVIPIAIYHCNIGIVSRGKGKSAVAAAAYRSGEKITNEWDEMTHDYTRKRGVVHTEILLPPHARPLSLTALLCGTVWSFTRKPGILFLSICFKRNVR